MDYYALAIHIPVAAVIRNRLHIAWLEETGSVFPSVIFVITVIILMAGILFSGMVMQNRFIDRDRDAVQARYTAEGGVFQFLASDSLVLTDSLEVVLADSNRAFVRSEFHGGFLKLVSSATIGSQTKKIRVLAGQKPDHAYDHAVILGDIRSALHVTGSTVIVGDIDVGKLGLKESPFKGKFFTGTVNGSVDTLTQSPLPQYDPDTFRNQVEQFNRLIAKPEESWTILKQDRYGSSSIESRKPKTVIYSQGDLELFSLGESDWPSELTVISKGSITISGKINLGRFTRFISSGRIELNGKINGEHALFYARLGIALIRQVEMSAQLISRKEITLSDDSYLRYPSILYLENSGEGQIRQGRIELYDNAILDGVAIVPRPDSVYTEDETKIIINDKAAIRGGIYNTGKTELHGKVLGSVLTLQFYFYKSPTTYINWIKDATVDISGRPTKFILPIGFSHNRNYDIIDWREL